MRERGTCAYGRIWTKEEDKYLNKYYPDLRQICRILTHRTKKAIQSRACFLKITKPITHYWNCNEISILRRLYPNHCTSYIMEMIPKASSQAILNKAFSLGLRKKKRPWKKTGHRLLDALRQMSQSLGYTLADMGDLIGRPPYFRCLRNRDVRLITAAIRALGGKVTLGGRVVWA